MMCMKHCMKLGCIEVSKVIDRIEDVLYEAIEITQRSIGLRYFYVKIS